MHFGARIAAPAMEGVVKCQALFKLFVVVTDDARQAW